NVSCASSPVKRKFGENATSAKLAGRATAGGPGRTPSDPKGGARLFDPGLGLGRVDTSASHGRSAGQVCDSNLTRCPEAADARDRRGRPDSWIKTARWR